MSILFYEVSVEIYGCIFDSVVNVFEKGVFFVGENGMDFVEFV